jgi:ApbE superfamily uncharacterized protein (UPF0280 family)
VERHHFEYKDTIATLLCDPEYAETGMRSLLRSRTELESTIETHPLFRTTHDPFPSSEGDPELVLRMIRESAKAGVGPMAAVAGAFAEAALRAMLDAGAPEAIVDNGGDIAFFIRRPVTVGIYAGSSPVRDLAFEVLPRGATFGICTSSGTVGPSFSYGKADAAVVVSPNVALADAAATALGNRVKEEADLGSCFDFMETIPDIEGAMVVFRDKMAFWGDLPRLVRSRVDVDLITKGKR